MRIGIIITALCALVSATPGTAVPPATPDVRLSDVDDGKGTPFVVDKKDNICGLDEPKQLSNPAKVDYTACLEATAEVKKIQREKIDPDSAEGIRLTAEARKKVLRACENVRVDKNHCSVWKKIDYRDRKRQVKDITSLVKKEIAKKEK